MRKMSKSIEIKTVEINPNYKHYPYFCIRLLLKPGKLYDEYG